MNTIEVGICNLSIFQPLPKLFHIRILGPMKKQNTNSGQKKGKKQTAIEYIKDEHPELTYEEIQDYDRALDDYLNICMEMYWARVKDGTFPWPDEDLGVGDNGDSTL